MKKHKEMSALLLSCMLLMTGCGSAKLPEVINTSTISVDKEGSIASYLIGEFNKEYYDISELTDMAVKDAAAYNEEHQEDGATLLTVEKVELLGSGDRVLVQHIYHNAETYADYNEGVFFYGTVEEAIKAGYDLSGRLTGVKDGEVLSEEKLMKKPEKSHVLITDAKAAIYCPHRVTHVGEGVGYLEDGSVDTTQTAGVAVVLMR